MAEDENEGVCVLSTLPVAVDGLVGLAEGSQLEEAWSVIDAHAVTAAEADVEALADMEGEGRPDAEGEPDNEIEDVSECGDVLDRVGCIVFEGLSLLVVVENPVLLVLVDRLIVGVAVGLEDAVRLAVTHTVDDRVALRVSEALLDAERSEEKVLHTVLDAVRRGD